MQVIITVACLGLLLWTELAAAQNSLPRVTHPLTVSKHESINLTEAQVRDILERASKLLEEDLRCNVGFRLDGSIGTFATSTPKIINNADDLEAVHRESAHVKVVEQIKFCKQRAARGQPFLGCAWRPGGRPKTMIVTKVESNLSDIVWAHEFGHTTGLQHRVGTDVLMTPCQLYYNTIEIKPAECRCFRLGQGGCTIRDRNVACRERW